MRCADLLPAIAAPESSYPPELADWTCQAFPNDNLPRDSLIVALISLALAIPVTVFLSGCFEIANDSEAPESWLRYAGAVRFICGLQAHRRWHYTGAKGQPNRFVRWYVRCADAPMAETLMNLLHSVRASVTGKPPPWLEQHEHPAAEAGRFHNINMQTCLRMLKRKHKSLHTTDAAEPSIKVHVGDVDNAQAAPAAEAQTCDDDDSLYLSADSGSAGWVSAGSSSALAQTAEAVAECSEQTIQVLVGDDDGLQAALAGKAVDECLEQAIEVIVGDDDDSFLAAEPRNRGTAEPMDVRARRSIQLLLADDETWHGTLAVDAALRRDEQTSQLLVGEDVTLEASQAMYEGTTQRIIHTLMLGDASLGAAQKAEATDENAKRLIPMLLADDVCLLGAAETTEAGTAHGEAAISAHDPSEKFSFNLVPDELLGTLPTINGADGLHDKLSPAEEARAIRRLKRQLTALGLGGVLLVWAIMTWFILTYGLLIYELLGRDAQHSFVNSWGVSYGIGAALEWRDVLNQAARSVVLLAIAERLHLTRPVAWVEEHIDYLSTSALLLEHGGLSYFQELRLFFTFRRRLSD